MEVFLLREGVDYSSQRARGNQELCFAPSVPERHVAEDVVPFLKRLSYSTPDAYGQVCQRLGWTTPRLPNTPEEAEAFVAALRGMP